jgi:tetratricopeptide (TPR) repeat protein
MRSSVPFPLLLIAAASLSAQTNPFSELRGELRTEGGVLQDMQMRLELHDAHGQLTAAVPMLSDGRFNFSGIAAGDYELVVLSADGREIARQRVDVREFASGVVVDVPGESGQSVKRDTGGTVSVHALQHRVDREAASLQKQAITAHEHHDRGRTVELLRQALARDPLFASAHYLLGLEYALNGELNSAAQELGRAVELDAFSAAAQGSYALVLLHLRDVNQAHTHAARAVQLDPRSAKYRYILGVSLVDAGRSDEGLSYLREAAAEVPAARELASLVEERLLAGKSIAAEQDRK